MPRSLAWNFFSRKHRRVTTAFCMFSSKDSGVSKGSFAFISSTCNWSSFPNVKVGCSTKLTHFPQKALITLSTIGNAFKSSFTRENSCSGPNTSSGLYVATPLSLAVRSMVRQSWILPCFSKLVNICCQRSALATLEINLSGCL